MSKTNAKSTKIAAASAWIWPPLRICVEVSARSNAATEAGLDPKDKSFAAIVDSDGVAAMMRSLGWVGAPSERPELAAASLDMLVEMLVEQACMLSGAEYPSMQGAQGAQPSKSLEKIDAQWSQALQGSQPWRPGALAAGLSSLWRVHIPTDRSVGAARLSRSGMAASILASHEECAQQCAATMADQIERLGARCSIQTWSMGKDPLPSLLRPKWDWEAMGEAVCIELSDESVACAWIPKSANARIQKSPLGRAFGPWWGMKLLGEHPALRSVFGTGHSSSSYTASSLTGELKDQHFPCMTFRGRHEWRGTPAATAQEAIDALREVSGGGRDVTLVAPSPEDVMRRAAAQAWLVDLSESMVALRQAKELSKDVQVKSGRPKASPKRSL